MSTGTTRAFIQARMTSRRFPGKVLAPFRGEPILRHVVRAVGQSLPHDRIVIVTSSEASDDPVAAYAATIGVECFRGPLDDVLERFRQAAAAFPSEWILRVSADSPLLDPAVLRRVMNAASDEVDLVSTICPRTFPHGHNAELIRTTVLRAVDPADLSPDDREHVTPFFYRHPERFMIRNIESDDPHRAAETLAVDSIDDLERLERLPG